MRSDLGNLRETLRLSLAIDNGEVRSWPRSVRRAHAIAAIRALVPM